MSAMTTVVVASILRLRTFASSHAPPRFELHLTSDLARERDTRIGVGRKVPQPLAADPDAGAAARYFDHGPDRLIALVGERGYRRAARHGHLGGVVLLVALEAVQVHHICHGGRKSPDCALFRRLS
jgi:hypothetical protein